MNKTSESEPTPVSLGFHMPAEWEPLDAVWLSWPHNPETWPGAFAPVPAIFSTLARHISEVALVRINVADESMADSVRSLLKQSGTQLDNVRFHFNPTNDAWGRDHGPIYVVREVNGSRQRAITNWGYNSWGGKYPPFDLDNAVPERISEEFDEYLFNGNMILEGGSIDVNGSGLLLTTTSCLLNENRNPQLSQTEIESRLRDYLGVEKILWLGDGIIGDDTDGHIDDITRFVDTNVIVTVIEDDQNDANFHPLQENLESLRKMTNLQDRPFEIITLPMPSAVHHGEHRLPASYANFLICNEKVLVPTYRCDHDAVAIAILRELFPKRTVVGIDCTDLVWGLGAIHCVTQQQPQASEVLSRDEVTGQEKC